MTEHKGSQPLFAIFALSLYTLFLGCYSIYHFCAGADDTVVQPPYLQVSDNVCSCCRENNKSLPRVSSSLGLPPCLREPCAWSNPAIAAKGSPPRALTCTLETRSCCCLLHGLVPLHTGQAEEVSGQPVGQQSCHQTCVCVFAAGGHARRGLGKGHSWTGWSIAAVLPGEQSPSSNMHASACIA